MAHTFARLHALLPPLLLAASALPLGAQTKPTVLAPMTLAGTIAGLPRPAQGILLAVGAEKVTVPAGGPAPMRDGADLDTDVLAFGQQAQTFCPVIAIAPISRAVLNEDPAPPDLSADLSPFEAFKRLAASLDDGQWAALISERGLGLGDLTGETQPALFHALFRRGRLWVASQDPALADLPDDKRTDARDVSDQISGVRLRLGQTAHLYVHDRAGKTIFFSTKAPETLQRLHTWSPKLDPPAAQHNVQLRAMAANAPRAGDLSLTDAAYGVAVPLAGLRTVGDLVSRLAAQTHTEIYADPHYAHRTLTLIGPAASAPANDLLTALALAVAGTYHQVGPAFVLTDDLAGVGARRQRLRDWEDLAFNSSSKLSDQAGEVLLKRRVSQARTLPTFGDPAALTSSQIAAMKEDLAAPGIPGEDEKYPYAKLTAAQQGLVRSTVAAYEELRAANKLPSYLNENGTQDPDPTGPVSLRQEYKVQMLVPTVDAPVETNLHNWMSVLFYPGEAAFWEWQRANGQPQPMAALSPAPPLMPLLRSRPRRAVIGHPRTVADVDALIAAMKKIGLNELWLDVFSGGISHLGGTDSDILTEALKQTAGTKIAVYADLSLLPWGSTPPDSARDLSILGETSRELAVHAYARSQETDFDDDGKPVPFVLPPVIVSPAATTVRTTLAARVREMAARTGLAGFVWEDAEADDALGYTPQMRLRFLRGVHADPLDITPGGEGRGDVSLPTFDDAEADKALPDLWHKARTQAKAELLGAMRLAMSSPTLPILMEQSGGQSDWLASWDDPRSVPPPLRPLFTDEPSFPERARVIADARRQGRAVLLREGIKNAADTDALAHALGADLAAAGSNKTPWDGFVLDFADAAATRGTEPLAALVRAAAEGDTPRTLPAR